MIFAGIGWRAVTSKEDVINTIERAVELSAEGVSISAIAIPKFKGSQPFILEVAEHFGVPLISVDEEAMKTAQTRCATLSVHGLLKTGFASVAEGAALGAAGRDSELLVPKITGKNATCALARRHER
ncbi:cobalamin biosynthesis protein CbiG [Rhodoligotrophos appendicifer]|uniref:cobalamin biosynthesis protein n=1 Tax=Rhodoligotrophos appendicifer TaxID=987056 RepID=UPI001184C6D6|nr:cobalamin biosynthesis protein [Rhodoligotrophos appendicifer]